MVFESVNPATGQKIASYEEWPREKWSQALEECHGAFSTWRRRSLAERGALLRRAADVLEKQKEALARMASQEMGKPLAQGRGEVGKCALACRFYADNAEKFLAPDLIATDASKSYAAYEPLGVVLALMPWNFPYWQVFRCAAPALMAGNAVALKHANNVTGCALALEKVFMEAGFPQGVFRTLVAGIPAVKDIIAHPRVRGVALTGSTPAGKAVGSQAGAVLKKVVLELGGSDPYIVLADADLDLAAKTCAASRLINTGQSCIAAKRFVVVEKIRAEFEKRFVEFMRQQKMGDPLEEGVTMGPLARPDLRDNLHKQVQESVAKGAKLLLGGEVPPGPGAFYPPTVLTDVKKGMRAYEEELFGPVASIIPVADETAALAAANDTIYGLGAAIFTRDAARAETLAREIEAGSVFINAFVRSDPRLPFGGVKESGFGRELSRHGIQEFVNIKTVYIQ